MSINYKFGWLPDLPDVRDYVVPKLTRAQIRKLKKKVDLRPKMPPILDQGQLGSCTANAIASAFRFVTSKQRRKDFAPSRLFIYYNERVMLGTINSDSGAYIRDGIKSVNSDGVCREKLWPYNIQDFQIRPSDKAYVEALKHQSLEYRRVERTIEDMKGVLCHGRPFVFGFTVYTSFEKVGETGIATLPEPGERVMGGHAVLCVGYNDATQRFIVKNSWGKYWGKEGYFEMPYEYLTNPNLSDDFWVISKLK